MIRIPWRKTRPADTRLRLPKGVLCAACATPRRSRSPALPGVRRRAENAARCGHRGDHVGRADVHRRPPARRGHVESPPRQADPGVPRGEAARRGVAAVRCSVAAGACRAGRADDPHPGRLRRIGRAREAHRRGSREDRARPRSGYGAGRDQGAGGTGDRPAAGEEHLRRARNVGRRSGREWTGHRQPGVAAQLKDMGRRFDDRAGTNVPADDGTHKADIEKFYANRPLAEVLRRIWDFGVDNATRQLNTALNLMVFDDQDAIERDIAAAIGHAGPGARTSTAAAAAAAFPLEQMTTCQESWLDWRTIPPPPRAAATAFARSSEGGNDAFFVPILQRDADGPPRQPGLLEQRRHGRRLLGPGQGAIRAGEEGGRAVAPQAPHEVRDERRHADVRVELPRRRP